MSNGIERYRTALRAFGDVVARVPDERWAAPSPCPGWTARDVVEHMTGAQRALLALLGVEAGPAPEDLRAAWTAVEATVLTTLDDPALPHRPVPTPVGVLDGSELLDMSVVEPLVHRWDLATAVGVEATLDDTLAARCLEVARRYERALRAPGMYGPARPAPDGARPGQQLLAYLGRDPGRA